MAFLSATVMFICLNQIQNVQNFPYDSGQYWSLANPSVFFNFPQDVRGYFYPLLLLPAHFLANVFEGIPIYPYRLYSSIIYAFTLTVLLPSFYVIIFGGKVSFTRRMVVPILVIILFPGVIIYPLSDLPGFILYISCIYLLIKVSLEKNKLSYNSLLYLGFSGFLAYASYNTRTIYLIPLPMIILTIPFILFSNTKAISKVIATVIFIAGMGLASLPQCFINQNTVNRFTPAVITQVSDRSLFAMQLMWGITIQRYSTNIGSNGTPGQYFLDNAGIRLFEKKGLTRENVSIQDYISLVVHNPMFFIGSFTRHLLNGVDLRDGEVYIRDAKRSTNSIAFVNFSIIFTGFFIIFIRYAERVKSQISTTSSPNDGFPRERRGANYYWKLWLAIILFPILAIIPGAVETRFFLSFQLLIYCTIAFNSSIAELNNFFIRYFRVILILFIVFYFLFSSITLNTMSMQQYDGPNLKYLLLP
jgi:hypothetical protein